MTDMDTANNTSADIWLAGAFAAFTVDVMVYPLDTLKTRLQSPHYARLYRNGSNTAFRPAFYRGLYQGLGPVVLATLPASGAFFTTYEGVKTLCRQVPAPDFLVHAAASGVAELASCAILTPAEVIKQNAQMVDRRQSSSHRDGPRVVNTTNATLQTLQRFRAHPLALWRGYAALAGRNLPFTAMQFPMFEHVKTKIHRYRDDRGLRTNSLLESSIITAASAGAGGSLAAVVTTPIDVVKTRLMLSATEHHDGKKATGPPRKTGFMIARHVVEHEGVQGLFRGAALRGVWTMIGSGLYLGVYEGGRIYLAQRRGAEVEAEQYARE